MSSNARQYRIIPLLLNGHKLSG